MPVFFKCSACGGEHRSEIDFDKKAFDAGEFSDVGEVCPLTRENVTYDKSIMLWREPQPPASNNLDLSVSGRYRCVRRNNSEWPPRVISRFHISSHEDYRVAVVAQTDGHLEMGILRDDGVTIYQKKFQRVQFLGKGAFEFELRWGPERTGPTGILLNGQWLDPYVPGQTPREISTAGPVSHVKSFDHPDATMVCRPWIAKRRGKFGGTQPRSRRRPKSISEQAAELDVAIRNITKLLEHVDSKSDEGVLPFFVGDVVGPLAGQLRALVYWSRDATPDANYNPLLLRLASRGDLPLPVFAGSEEALPASHGRPELELEFSNVHMSLIQESSDHSLMDLQDWLVQRIGTYRDIGGKPGQRVVVTKKQLILETANTLGTSHYDEDMPDAIDAMHRIGELHGQFFWQNARVIVELSRWVLGELERKKIIGPRYGTGRRQP